MQKLEGFFEVSYDRDRKLLHITTYGFWNLDVVDRFARAIAEETRAADPSCDVLANTCRTEIHSAEVSEALSRLSYTHKDAETGRIAVVSPSVLLRMQTKRMQNMNTTYGYFETEQEALDWLATPADSSAPQARAAG
ncbi:hypothetical protein [Sphingobium sp. Cam5-1]|uniref:hypothetical protein n=1 Tax=Sphingobium sp. Cam5-1 TaxID=2789327 RepID=UPI0018AD1AFC|nr:hypothetical protein [Sphingobium sp. Cam5-1]QPI73055.1 hypothetical protein IZV00_00575 [Sphingobium sp. Cam5-1]